ncbi:hypothetical protein [Actinomadura rugatobispora]|uniref:Uncharacterized protein n=1 Tax=Actinomadura rugatobispora TaxID=1994 RepID=A0ABW1A9M9_9ACTN|nr:hypothetical protein GCM10010200_053590 [Actinomadura rugatobispora]
MGLEAFPELASLSRGLSPEERSTIGMLDLQRLKVEQSGVGTATAAQMTEPLYGVFACLRTWCLLIRRMEQGWPRTDYYMVYEYLNDLTVRDAIEEYLDTMPTGLKEKVRRVVARLDGRYSAVTVDDGGAELAGYWRPLAEGRECRWWWTRKPQELPPGW